MDTITQANIVLRGKLSYPDALATARTLGWKLAKKSERDDSAEYLWRADENNTVELHRTALGGPYDFFVVEGPRAEELRGAIRSHFATYSNEDILAILDASHTEDEQKAAFYLVIAAHFPGYIESIYQAIKQALEGNDKIVQILALMACSALRWRQLRPLIQQLEKRSTDNIQTMSHYKVRFTQWK